MNTVTANALYEWIQQQKVLVIDVREPKEHAENAIPESMLIPLGQVSVAAIPKTDKQIVIHCLKGGRGGKAYEKLIEEDASLPLHNLEGGIEAWIKAGLPLK